MGSYGLMLLPAQSAIISTVGRFLDRNDASYTRRRSSNKKHHYSRVSCCSGHQDLVVVVVDRRGMVLGSKGSSSAAAGATEIQQISGELYKCDKDAKTCHPLDAGVARFKLPSRHERELARRAFIAKFRKTIGRLKVPSVDPGSFENQHAAAVDDTRSLLFEGSHSWQARAASLRVTLV